MALQSGCGLARLLWLLAVGLLLGPSSPSSRILLLPYVSLASASLSSNCPITALSIVPGTISPTFTTEGTSYVLFVGEQQDTVEVEYEVRYCGELLRCAHAFLWWLT